MTAPLPWYGRPRIMVPLLLGISIMVALLTPERSPLSGGDDRLTTRATTPYAAALAMELPAALGWRTSETTRAELPRRRDMVHMLLDPAVPLRAKEIHALLERVRAGAGLFVIVTDRDGLLADSLHVHPGGPGTPRAAAPKVEGCEAQASNTFLWRLVRPQLAGVVFTAPPPGPVDTLLTIDIQIAGTRPTADSAATANDPPALVGFPYGAGRVVLGTDADFLRNDILRQCALGLAPVYIRALEYLRDTDGTARQWLLFDEYHQGYGVQPGTARAVVGFLADTAPGHVMAQLALAGLLVLLLRMPRLVPPVDVRRIERRSPIEHVDALARAYVHVGATRTATQRLVRGLRRRTERQSVRRSTSLDDAAWLERVASQRPPLAGAVRVVQRALAQGHAARDFAAVGAALATIEHSLRQDSA